MEMAALFSFPLGCLSFGLWLFLTLLWVGLHCEIVVFPDHTACTDPGNIIGGAGGPGPSGGGVVQLFLGGGGGGSNYKNPNNL